MLQNNTFKKYAPKIRYWLPEAYVEFDDIKRDIYEIHKRGYSGIEIVAFDSKDSIPLEYKWGSKRWNDLILLFLSETKKYQMTIDITNGPQWPISMPTIDNPNSPGSLYELTFGEIIINKGDTYTGAIPKPRITHPEVTSKLIALFTYEIKKDHTLLFNTYQNVFISSKQKEIKIKAKNTTILFAFYEQPACQKVLNQYYVIDHLSKEGTNQCITYFEKEFFPMINDHIDNIQSIFCDSLEYKVANEWTRNFDSSFLKRKGYSILPYLPFIGSEKTYPKNDIAKYQLDNKILNKQINNDYLEMLTHLYIKNHLIPLTNYFSTYNISLRYQVAYNKPFQVESTALHVSIPETEALNRPTIDNLKMMSGAIHMDHKSIYSYECSAEFGNCYGQSYEDLLWWIKRGYLGSINHQVLHGAAYSGRQPNKQTMDWPGFEPFSHMVSNYWNRTLSSKHSYSYIELISYYNQILSYTHKVDLAIYRHEYLNTGKGSDGNHVFKDHSIFLQHGYSYDFISPDLLHHKNAVIENCRLDISGASYKGLIISNQEHITLTTIHQLKQFAYHNFPIIFVGKLPYYSSYHHLKQDSKNIKQAIVSLLSLDSVYHFTTYKQAFNLIRQFIPSDAYYYHQAPVATIHTKDTHDDYYYLYHYQTIDYGYYPENNKDKDSFNPEQMYPTLNKKKYFHYTSLHLSLIGKGKPFLFDPLTKQFQRITKYQVNKGSITLDLYFKADEAKIVVISEKMLSNKKAIDFQAPSKEIPLYNWNLDVFQLNLKVPCTSFYDYEYVYKQSYQLNQLQPIHEIDYNLVYFAGKLIYSTTIQANHCSNNIVLFIEQVSDTYEIHINGVLINGIDTYHAYIPMNDYLILGDNKLEIIVYTNLYSYLLKKKKDYGIFGDIKLLYINQ